MNRCPRCNIELRAEARFCNRCGFDLTNARLMSIPNPPSSMPRTVQPSTKHTPQRPATHNFGQTTPPAPPSNELIHPLAQPVIKLTTQPDKHKQAGTEKPRPSSTTTPSPGLIRPLGMQPPQAQQFIKPASIPPELFQVAEQQRQQQPAHSLQEPQPQRGQVGRSEGAARSSTMPPMADLPTGHLAIGPVKGQPGLTNAPTTAGRSPESFAATSKAAERWRESWRDRQRAEAGPATNVSRGHASVPEPLLAMQHSFTRMRAIILPNRHHQSRNTDFSPWITIFLLVCLIGGLGVYITSIYLPNSRIAAQIAPPGDTSQPTLTIQGPQVASIAPGQTLHLHGEHFGANDPIIFLLDTTTPIPDVSGKQLTVQSTSQGSFDVALPIATTWLAGEHLISAQDSRTGQNAYLTIQVHPNGPVATTSSALALSVQGQPAPQLTFQAVVGQGDSAKKDITLTNTSGAPLQWTATASVDHDLSWLMIDNTNGHLAINGTDTIGVSVLTVGLKSSARPYSGQITFTINGKEQLALPVKLQVQNTPTEMVFSPNPLIGYIAQGGSCKPGTALTLVNFGDRPISWQVTADTFTKPHIQFTYNGKPDMQGQLAP